MFGRAEIMLCEVASMLGAVTSITGGVEPVFGGVELISNWLEAGLGGGPIAYIPAPRRSQEGMRRKTEDEDEDKNALKPRSSFIDVRRSPRLGHVSFYHSSRVAQSL